MVCSNFHSTRVCKLCLFLFAQFIVPYHRDRRPCAGAAQDLVSKRRSDVENKTPAAFAFKGQEPLRSLLRVLFSILLAEKGETAQS